MAILTQADRPWAPPPSASAAGAAVTAAGGEGGAEAGGKAEDIVLAGGIAHDFNNLPVVLEIRDDGVGMDGEIMERLFEPFYTTKISGKGTGLGLSVVYGVVKQSGGSIRLESEPGKGSCFTVYLPRIAQGEKEPASEETVPEQAAAGVTLRRSAPADPSAGDRPRPSGPAPRSQRSPG